MTAGFACLAVCSLLSVAGDASRPRYGGTLRVELPGVIRSLDPASAPADGLEADARAALFPLVYETLTRVDGVAGLQPLLARSWQADATRQRWQFHLRTGATLHDGSTLTPADVASVLRPSNSRWTVTETADGIAIECAEPSPDLPWELADSRRAIAVLRAGPHPVGTGPFRVDAFESGRRLVLAASSVSSAGRPFVDSVSIEMGRSFRDEIVSLETGRADLVALLPQDVRRVTDRRLRVAASRPRDLVALVFDPRRPAASSERLRAAVALAIDRASIGSVLLQRQADPAPALLPDWLSGYGSMFAARYDRAAARLLVGSLSLPRRTLSLQCQGTDPIAVAVADRVAVDAREVGLTVRITAPGVGSGPPPDARLVRSTIEVSTADRALASLVAPLALDRDGLPDASSLQAAARFEQALIERNLVVPLVHVPHTYGVGPRLESSDGRIVTAAGTLDLAGAWLRGGAP